MTQRTSYLIGHRYKLPGWILLGLFLIPSLYYLWQGGVQPDWLDVKLYALMDDDGLDGGRYFMVVQNNLLDEVLLTGLLVGCLLVAFSRQRTEDEFISRMRLEALVWATYVNYAILLLATVFIFGSFYLWVLVINTLSLLFLFILRFNWMLYRAGRKVNHEELHQGGARKALYYAGTAS